VLLQDDVGSRVVAAEQRYARRRVVGRGVHGPTVYRAALRRPSSGTTSMTILFRYEAIPETLILGLENVFQTRQGNGVL
jgi:hypothetical protein